MQGNKLFIFLINLNCKLINVDHVIRRVTVGTDFMTKKIMVEDREVLLQVVFNSNIYFLV